MNAGDEEPAPAPDAPAALSPAVPARGRRYGLWITPVLVGTAIVGAMLWRTRTPGAEAGPITVDVTPSAVVARGPDGTERWQYAFPREVRVVVEPTRVEGAVTTLAGSDPSFLVATTYANHVTDHRAISGELLRLRHDGHVERRFAFDDRVTFGATSYAAPWALVDYRPERLEPPARIALTAHHFQWWPSLVTILDGGFRRGQTFVNAGWIERVHWLSPDRLLIAGISNAHDGGMVALLDARAMHGQSPPSNDTAFTCTSCGTDTPLRYVVIPRSELNRVTGSTFNRAVVQVGPSSIVVRTIEIPSSGAEAIDALYEFSPSLALLTGSYSDRYWDLHRSLELAGRLDHPRERCPERAGPGRIRVWEPASGWTSEPQGRSSAHTR